MPNPLSLPKNFNSENFMLSKVTEYGTFHESRSAANLAKDLVANGTPQDLELAEKVIDAVLNCQELREGDPHYGNFFWMQEDDMVGDLNAVEFNLEKLIPMMLQHSNRLSIETRKRILQSIRLGLEEIRNLNVLVAYSNITMLDILNTCLGGELLNDPEISERGYKKLVEWISYTNQSGSLREFNSPTYGPVVIRALKCLTDHVRNKDTKIRAQTFSARLSLSIALHIHPTIGRWTGPHSRAYQPTIACKSPPELNMINDWIARGSIPAWINDVLKNSPLPFEIIETAIAEEISLTTYHSQSFALGVSTKETNGQSNTLIVHTHRKEHNRPGVLYTRYLTNDKWLGDFYHSTDRTMSRNLLDEGRFYGVQEGNRAIGLYAPSNLGVISSAKAALIFTERNLIDEIWIGNNRVQTLPVDIPPNEVVVIAHGSSLIAIRILTRTDLGRNAPIRLVEIKGDLVLEIYTYLGPKKSFWEMRWPGAFYKGQPQCGFFLEVSERTKYKNARAFSEVVSSGILKDTVRPPEVYDGKNERIWTIEYSRNGRILGLKVDLMEWVLKHRWTHKGTLGWPLLRSPFAKSTRTGIVTVGNATLTCSKNAAWLYASPSGTRFIAGTHGQTPSPLTLRVPTGKVGIEAMSTGTIVWDNGDVTVEGIGLKGKPDVTGGRLKHSTSSST